MIKPIRRVSIRGTDLALSFDSPLPDRPSCNLSLDEEGTRLGMFYRDGANTVFPSDDELWASNKQELESVSLRDLMMIHSFVDVMMIECWQNDTDIDTDVA